MRTRTVVEHVGEDMGPVDWDHPMAKALPESFRAKLMEAENNPGGFTYDAFPVVSVCMYDGWPYWRPTPAISYVGPLKIVEWAFFNDIGFCEHSIIDRRSAVTP